MMRRKIDLKLVLLLIALAYFGVLYSLSVYGTCSCTKSNDLPGFKSLHTNLKREYTVRKHIPNKGLEAKTGRNESTMKMLKTNESSADLIKLCNISFGNINKDSDRIKLQHSHNYSEGSVYRPLSFIPEVPDKTRPNYVPYLKSTVTEPFLALPDLNYNIRLVIASPIRNVEPTLETFKEQLLKLSYPHHLLSVYFGESESTDNTFRKAENITKVLQRFYNFSDSRVINLRMSGGVYGPQDARHKKEVQRYRRSFLAVARNRLARYALQQKHFDYILSIDSDLEEIPTDLVQQMLFAKSDIVVTSCLVKAHGLKFLYDLNSWKETNASLQSQTFLPPDALVIEGYDRTARQFLPHLKTEGRVVQLDGVGGCALMVKADCFRSGLLFPEVVYKRHIETEGLAKMGRDMGYSVVGLPFVEVFHQKWN